MKIEAGFQMSVYGDKGWVLDVCLVMEIKAVCQMSV